jgi:hypothetical protein
MISLIGLAIANQALIVSGAVLVCTPFLIKAIDAISVRKYSEAISFLGGIAVYIFICILFLSLGNGEVNEFLGRPAIWIVVVGAGFVQLLWVLLINPKN